VFYGLWSEINVNDDDDDDNDDKPPSDLIKEAHYITLRYITLKVVNSGLLHMQDCWTNIHGVGVQHCVLKLETGSI